MKMQELVQKVETMVSLTKRNVGEFAQIKAKGMRVKLESYQLGNWGTFSVMESRGLLGLMKRDAIVINAMTRDIPVFMCQFVSMAGKSVLQCDIMDVTTDKTVRSAFAPLAAIADGAAALADRPSPTEWYTDLLMPGSLAKTGRSQPLSALMAELTCAFVEGANAVRTCGYTDTRAAKVDKLLADLFDHGGFAYDAFRVCLKQEKTEEMYRCCLFGVQRGGTSLPDAQQNGNT